MQLADVLALGVRRFIEKRAGVVLPLAVGAMIPSIVHKALERANSTEQTLDRAAYNPMKMAADMSWAGRPSGGNGGGLLDFRRFFQDPMHGFPPQQRKPAPQTASTGTPATYGGAGGGGGMSPPPGLLASMMASQAGGQVAQGATDSLKGLVSSPIQGVAQGISGGIGDVIKRKLLGREFGDRKDPAHMMGGEAIKTFGKEMGTSGANLLRDIANKAMEAAGHAGDASAREAILGDLKKTDSVLANADDTTLMEAYHTMTRFAPVLSTDKNAVRSFLRQAVMSGSGPDFMSIKLLADSERAVTGEKDKR